MLATAATTTTRPAPARAAAPVPNAEAGLVEQSSVPALAIDAKSDVAQKDAELEEEDDVVTNVDYDFIALKIPSRVAVKLFSDATPGGPDDPVDRIGREALRLDPDAPLFHYLLPFATDDDRTLRYLMMATRTRATIVHRPTIENVRDYIVAAMLIQRSIDHYNGQPNRAAIHFSAMPRFVIGRLQTTSLLGDIMHWLGLLGLSVLWLSIDQMYQQLQAAFGIPWLLCPGADVIRAKVSRTPMSTIHTAAYAFVILSNEFEEHHGYEWEGMFSFDSRKWPGLAADGARMHLDNIRAIRLLVTAVLSMWFWIDDKNARQKRSSEVLYTMADVSTVHLCMHKINEAKSTITNLRRACPGVRETEFHIRDLLLFSTYLRMFSIASEIASRPDEMPNAAWYLARLPEHWFPALKQKVVKKIGEETAKAAADEGRKEPEMSKDRFDPKVIDNTDAFHYLRLAPDAWGPKILRLRIHDSSARPLSGLDWQGKRNRPRRTKNKADAERALAAAAAAAGAPKAAAGAGARS